jgi:hypothetical protein
MSFSFFNKRSLWHCVCLSFCLLMIGCNTTSPEKYFGLTVLTTNMINGISGDGSMAELVYPSAKMVDGDVNKSVAMKRKEMLDNKIQYLEENFEKLTDLKETAETKELLQAAVSLNKYVLPIYKNEYQQLAKLYDDGAPATQIKAMEQSIHDKYSVAYEGLLNKLISAGKVYAANNNIKVNWGIQNTPL